MRTTLPVGLTGLVLTAALCCQANAADCVDPKTNNPAFSSPYVEAVKPCPPPLTPLAKPAAPKSHARTAELAKNPAESTDKPIVTSKPGGGTLIKYGETTVCVSGSVTVDVSTGNRVRSGVLPGSRDVPVCN